MKTVNERKLLKLIFEFYNDQERKGAIVLPCDEDGKVRWYITKIPNAFLEFLEDQPLLKEISKRTGLDWNKIKNNVKQVEGIGAWLRFIPGIIESEDILINQYNIQPYPIEHIDDVPEMMVDLLQESLGNSIYSGPFKQNNKVDELQCCIYSITEDELWKDIKRFREGKNEYHTNFDNLDYTL